MLKSHFLFMPKPKETIPTACHLNHRRCITFNQGEACYKRSIIHACKDENPAHSVLGSLSRGHLSPPPLMPTFVAVTGQAWIRLLTPGIKLGKRIQNYLLQGRGTLRPQLPPLLQFIRITLMVSLELEDYHSKWSWTLILWPLQNGKGIQLSLHVYTVREGWPGCSLGHRKSGSLGLTVALYSVVWW